MAIDGLTLKATISELQNKLVGGRLQKSYQPNKDEIILNIYNNNTNYRLLVNCNAQNYRVHLTSHISPNPLQAPLFCMLLRKHLDGGRITKICQPGLERLVHIYVSSRDELGNSIEKVLISEMMGKHSNIILCYSESLKIIDAVKRIPFGVSSVRQILPGFSYIAPPSEKLSILGDTLPPLTSDNLDTALVNTFEGLSPLVARELVYRAKGYQGAVDAIRNMVKNNSFEPAITLGQKAVCGALRYTHISDLTKNFTSMNEALDNYYCTKKTNSEIKNLKQTLTKVVNKELSRNRRTLKKQNVELKNAKKAEQYKRQADLIKANLYQIEQGHSEVTVIDYYHPDMPSVKIELIPHLTPQKNLTKLYQKYEKAIRTQENLKKHLKKTTSEIEYLESIITAIDISQTVEDLLEVKDELITEGYLKNKTQKKLKRTQSKEIVVSNPRKYITEDQVIIEVGRNNRQNDKLTLRKANKDDIWFHVKDIPGAHVVIRCNGNNVTDNCLLQAANLAAYFSKARESSNVPVDYTLVKHVFKQRGARPGQVFYTHQKTLYVTPDEEAFPKEAN